MRLQVLKNALRPTIIAANNGDPFTLIPNAARPRELAEPHPIWSDQVLRAVIDQAVAEQKFGLARAVALGRYTGARRGDLVTMLTTSRRGGDVSWLSGRRKVKVDIEEPAS